MESPIVKRFCGRAPFGDANAWVVTSGTVEAAGADWGAANSSAGANDSSTQHSGLSMTVRSAIRTAYLGRTPQLSDKIGDMKDCHRWTAYMKMQTMTKKEQRRTKPLI